MCSDAKNTRIRWHASCLFIVMTETVFRLSLGRRYSKQRSRSSGNLSIRRYSTDVASYSETVGRRLSQGASNSPPDFNTRKQLIRRSSGNPSPADSSRMSIFSASELIGAKLSNNNLYVENDLPRSPNLLSPGVFFRYLQRVYKIFSKGAIRV